MLTQLVRVCACLLSTLDGTGLILLRSTALRFMVSQTKEKTLTVSDLFSFLTGGAFHHIQMRKNFELRLHCTL